MNVVVADGVALHADRWDGGDRVPFLLVHGLASNCRTWDGVAARLVELGHPVASVDLRGHGRSDKPDHGYDFATLCRDLLVVLDALGYDRPVLAGQSTGGNLAVDLAARAPERLAGIAGVDGGAFEMQRRWPEWGACMTALAPPKLAGSPARVVEDRLRAAHPDWPEWGIESTMANFEHLPDGAIRPRLQLDHHLRILRALWEHTPSAIVPTLSNPVLLVLAEADDGWMDHRRTMADAIATAAPKVRV